MEDDCEFIENLSVTNFWKAVLKELGEKTADDAKPVSYTHLTLPTTLVV